ncbi:MAG: 5 10-methenyltetrahydrofolate synthetase [Erysipelotrichaceae bacterium]|nr:MAG: 5 10-methenyltetrahydrofolate [Erysipelotrichaceae bacterium]TXT18771.1 MAG: 5 10-methenyltetrahydrofolate synthetase [Erysipelotrichaceae bacterium]
MDKAALRQKHKDRRVSSDLSLNLAASFCIQEKLWLKIESYESIGIYISMKGEVQTLELIKKCLDAGKIICVPKIVNGNMMFVRIHDFQECAISSYGMMEPISSDPYQEKIDVQIIPMLAFNEENYRLGFGKGYYDAYLKNYTGLKLGICYSEDLDPELKETEFDVKCDEILTES